MNNATFNDFNQFPSPFENENKSVNNDRSGGLINHLLSYQISSNKPMNREKKEPKREKDKKQYANQSIHSARQR